MRNSKKEEEERDKKEREGDNRPWSKEEDDIVAPIDGLKLPSAPIQLQRCNQLSRFTHPLDLSLINCRKWNCFVYGVSSSFFPSIF